MTTTAESVSGSKYHDEMCREVDAGTFRIRQRPVEFGLQSFLEDPDGYNASLLEVLRAN